MFGSFDFVLKAFNLGVVIYPA